MNFKSSALFFFFLSLSYPEQTKYLSRTPETHSCGQIEQFWREFCPVFPHQREAHHKKGLAGCPSSPGQNPPTYFPFTVHYAEKYVFLAFQNTKYPIWGLSPPPCKCSKIVWFYTRPSTGKVKRYETGIIAFQLPTMLREYYRLCLPFSAPFWPSVGLRSVPQFRLNLDSLKKSTQARYTELAPFGGII